MLYKPVSYTHLDVYKRQAEGITCVEKIAGKNPEPIDYGNIPTCTYCVPEVASVGLTEEEAKAKGCLLYTSRCV